ncbi:hypothetical protein C8Z91_01095 [Paenibacillus elgii]|uniref:LysM domain-containing protein n=1 Tax=Paenibacillus elgii TaxID=189691 RepID=A0A2T6GA33_9BACL|nr:hypothetical protein [Paenibacillus elgii]PUA41020.1 hypothetical protein C8Z91_01095 [Paenibacillus elgii]
MKTIGKKLMAGTIAAGFLLGGAGLYYTQAYAATTTTESGTTADSAQQGHGHGKFGKGGFGREEHGFRGVNILKETATLLNLDEKTLKDELKQNKTLAQIAQEKGGLTEDALIQKLTDTETKAIDDAVSAGKITQDQADKRKANLADHLKKAVTATKLEGHHGEKGERGAFGMMGNPENLTKILGITQQELTDSMKAGKSLAEIAQDKGISRDQLISQIKSNLDDAIGKFVDRKPGQHKDAASTDSTNSAN